jgi:3-phenylpropionate/trans-cinnamate dioxygenase ferredoxin reductase subunit
MFGFLKGNQPLTVSIEGLDKAFLAEKKETLLQTVLREGVAFPHSCRVGGCATCKCRLVSGKVKELTESAYVLSEEELAQGYILACQSVPKTPVTLALDQAWLPQSVHSVVRVKGVINAVDKLTHDIVRLQINLEQPLSWKAGQYALLRIPGRFDEGRSYSFATAAKPGGQSEVVFFIRQVPGGAFSTWIQSLERVGEGVQLEGPFGDFYLRQSDAPMLCIAGGSGLAPLMALLEHAMQIQVRRDLVLLFGARTEKDLYCLEAIARIASNWSGSSFCFIPVLSEELAESAWSGARGWVTEVIDSVWRPDAQVYMCGPPPMLDAAEARLKALGTAQNQIFADRFTDRSSLKAVS